ncbi:hypothetical protein PybrP1_011825 [[Pythium] brassicae (nom. inval.)]|nr:hypothetical protein PybrP1_011825 [[Pythium] brassicae (nom. inval.)]
MGGPSAAAAYAASATASAKHQRMNAAVHSLRQTAQHGGASSTSRDNSGNNGADESDGFLSDDYAGDSEGFGGDIGAEGEDNVALYEEQVRAAAMARERDEMKKHFNFPLEKRRGLTSRLVIAMRKKRRLLLRNENLRFRELYKPPEPMVLLIAASLVTILEDLRLLSDPSESDGVLDAGSPKGALAWTTLQFACALGDEALVTTLLQKESGAFSVGKTKYGYSPLHVAVRFGHPRIVKVLLAHVGSEAAAGSTDAQVGATALHLAVVTGNLEIVRLLLDADASHSQTKNGTTPLDVAKELGLVKVTQVLTDHLAKAAGKEQIGNWLASIGMVEYAPSFHDAGFDDALFLLANGLSDAALDDLKVHKPGHRAKLRSLYRLKDALASLADSESSDYDDEEESEDSGSSNGSGSEGESDSQEDSESEEKTAPVLVVAIGYLPTPVASRTVDRAVNGRDGLVVQVDGVRRRDFVRHVERRVLRVHGLVDHDPRDAAEHEQREDEDDAVGRHASRERPDELVSALQPVLHAHDFVRDLHDLLPLLAELLARRDRHVFRVLDHLLRADEALLGLLLDVHSLVEHFLVAHLPRVALRWAANGRPVPEQPAALVLCLRPLHFLRQLLDAVRELVEFLQRHT